MFIVMTVIIVCTKAIEMSMAYHMPLYISQYAAAIAGITCILLIQERLS